MVRWIAFILFFLFILPAFADKKKKTENIQELDEKTRLEFVYSFMEGGRSKITFPEFVRIFTAFYSA